MSRIPGAITINDLYRKQPLRPPRPSADEQMRQQATLKYRAMRLATVWMCDEGKGLHLGPDAAAFWLDRIAVLRREVYRIRGARYASENEVLADNIHEALRRLAEERPDVYGGPAGYRFAIWEALAKAQESLAAAGRKPSDVARIEVLRQGDRMVATVDLKPGVES